MLSYQDEQTLHFHKKKKKRLTQQPLTNTHLNLYTHLSHISVWVIWVQSQEHQQVYRQLEVQVTAGCMSSSVPSTRNLLLAHTNFLSAVFHIAAHRCREVHSHWGLVVCLLLVCFISGFCPHFICSVGRSPRKFQRTRRPRTSLPASHMNSAAGGKQMALKQHVSYFLSLQLERKQDSFHRGTGLSTQRRDESWSLGQFKVRGQVCLREEPSWILLCVVSTPPWWDSNCTTTGIKWLAMVHMLFCPSGWCWKCNWSCFAAMASPTDLCSLSDFFQSVLIHLQAFINVALRKIWQCYDHLNRLATSVQIQALILCVHNLRIALQLSNVKCW